MVGGPWHGHCNALTPTRRQQRWRVNEKHKTKLARSAGVERAMAVRIEAVQLAFDDTTKVYDVILAAPPWRFEPYSRITGMSIDGATWAAATRSRPG